jgi:hypothetical protein
VKCNIFEYKRLPAVLSIAIKNIFVNRILRLVLEVERHKKIS